MVFIKQLEFGICIHITGIGICIHGTRIGICIVYDAIRTLINHEASF